MNQLMTKSQMAQMLEALPASCVMDAIEKVMPRVDMARARMVMLNLEESGFVLWNRDKPQTIALTEKGKVTLKALKAELT